MKKCPYCYEPLEQEGTRCPHCQQFIIDEIIDVDYPSVDKKSCVFCGKKINQEARYCKFCKRWIDEIDRIAGEIDPRDLV